MGITLILFAAAVFFALMKPTSEMYVEVARIVPIEDPEIGQAINTLRSYGYLKKDARRYVEMAYNEGSSNDCLVSDALSKIEI